MAKIITRSVWILSLVSLFTDIASEMLYPVMPLYLQQIGFSIVGIGVLEGFAEAIAGIGKGYFGKWSDTIGRRLPFVKLGYALSAISKPMMALFTFPAFIFGARSLDRIGKGLRTGARDAILSQQATVQTKATVFGFHRSLDTLGATIGPVLSLIFLYFHPADFRTLFLIAFIPGLLAIAATFLLKEKPFVATTHFNKAAIFSFLGYWKNSRPTYKKLVAALLVFGLANSSDVFLLLKMKEQGIDDTLLIGVYIFYNAIYAMTAFPLGKMADKIGVKKMLIFGLLIFSLVYFLMSFVHTLPCYILIFLLYGIYAAASEGVAKAWLSNLAENNKTATALGTYTGLQSIAALLSSSIAGWLWFGLGSNAVFISAGFVTCLVVVYIYTSIKELPDVKS